MDVIEFAMQMELDGRDFYLRSSQHVKQPELQEILKYLADEENRHYNFFKRLHDGQMEAAIQELDTSTSLKQTKNVFVKLSEEGKEKEFGDDARKVWLEAMNIEEKSVKLYTTEAAKETDAERRELLNRIAAEEQNHVYLIDNVLAFMTDPGEFIESQKFAKFKSWEGK
jgi:rubrerythrin